MSVVAIGLNQATVPLELLERVAVAPDRLPKALHDLCARPNVSEAILVSTCNRTEVYVVAERFHGAYQDVRDFFSDLGGLAPDEFSEHLYSYFDDGAVNHLFEVAAGLDSVVLGESEILGQVRTAWERARQEGTARATLNGLFRHAVEVGKRVRTETAIGRSTASVSHAAIEMAAARLGPLTGRPVLVLGAGEMGEGMVVALAAAGVGEILIANRTVERAAQLAARVGGRAIPLGAVGSALASVDVVLTSTGATSILLDHGDVESVLAARAGAPLLIVDIAVPRDVDPSVGELPGVTLLDLDDLRAFADQGRARRRGEMSAARVIVEAEVERYLDQSLARTVAPLITVMHRRAEEVRSAEVDRFAGRLAGLDERQREAVQALTHGIVAKLLRDPTMRLKAVAGTPRGERLADALRDLFALGDD